MQAIKIGMIGLGTVGGGTAAMLMKNRGFISKTVGAVVELKKILIKDINKDRPGLDKSLAEKLTDDPADIFSDDDIDIVVEVMGGTDTAYEYVKKALSLKKHVVTANKDMMAEYAGELFELAEKKGVQLHFEASVCAAIPIVEVLKKSLAGNKISRILGILNGTTNYILTKMDTEGLGYEEALQDAMEMGYAESNPDSDVMGYDAARKIAILAAIAFNMKVGSGDVYTEGINKLTASDICYAEELGYRIKLIASAGYEDGGVEVRVNPLLMPKDHPLAKVDGVFNAIFIESDMAGETMLYGKGAGSDPTASAVVGDIISIAGDIFAGSTARTGYAFFNEKKIIPPEKAVNQFYIRLTVSDSPGVLAKIAGILSDNEVSIYSVVQEKAHGETAEIVMITHKVVEGNMMKSLSEMGGLDVVSEISSVVRVEDE